MSPQPTDGIACTVLFGTPGDTVPDTKRFPKRHYLRTECIALGVDTGLIYNLPAQRVRDDIAGFGLTQRDIPRIFAGQLGVVHTHSLRYLVDENARDLVMGIQAFCGPISAKRVKHTLRLGKPGHKCQGAAYGCYVSILYSGIQN